MKPGNEFEKFDSTMRKLIKVSHSEIKAKLDKERSLKKRIRHASSFHYFRVATLFILGKEKRAAGRASSSGIPASIEP